MMLMILVVFYFVLYYTFCSYVFMFYLKFNNSHIKLYTANRSFVKFEDFLFIHLGKEISA